MFVTYGTNRLSNKIQYNLNNSSGHKILRRPYNESIAAAHKGGIMKNVVQRTVWQKKTNIKDPRFDAGQVKRHGHRSSGDTLHIFTF